MKRILVVSAVLALAGAITPWNGSAGADVPALDTSPPCSSSASSC